MVLLWTNGNAKYAILSESLTKKPPSNGLSVNFQSTTEKRWEQECN